MKIKRKTILKIHKYLGLVTGIVIVLVSITGALWAFKTEIENIVDKEYLSIQKENKAKINVLTVKEIAQNVFPNQTIHGAIFHKETKPVEVVFYDDEPKFYQSVFLNPYTGKVLLIKNRDKGFFAFVLDGHLHLWLPKIIGSRVVSYSILLFFIILISGIILWWPKNKKARKMRFRFDWKKTTRWKRKNYDLHNVIGFYSWSLASVFAFTGCVLAFNWFYFITYKVFGGSKAPQFIMPKNISTANNAGNKLNDLLPYLNKNYPKALSHEIHYPTDSTSTILVENVYSENNFYNIDYLFFDQNTLQEVETTSIYGRYKNANLSDKVIRMNYDIHIGSILGLSTKILMFISSLILASLPITGFLIWWGKKRKKERKKERKKNLFNHNR